jgi:eukaryotic-like serine/threonine-protein kinase
MVDRDLRLGLRALREGIVGPDQLCEAMEELVRRGGSSLSTILVDRGWASRSQLADLERRAAGGSTDLQDEADEEGTGRPDDSVGSSMSTIEHRSNKGWSPPKRGRGPINGPTAGERYERVRVHATGGLGRVWLARDTHLGREVALKELRDDRLNDPQMIARFLEEARITGQLEHPGIVPLHDLIEGDGADSLPFHTMRFLSGRTLNVAVEGYHSRREAGKSAGPLELRSLLDAFRTVCQTVAYAHSRDVIHRDLKGQNIILGDFGEVFVVDWGLAKKPETARPAEGPSSFGREPVGRHETEPGSVLGTPGFIAPELLDGHPADRRSDVYSLGAILYLILTGRAPYSNWGRPEIPKVIRERDPDHPRTLVSDAPPALVAICLKAMDRDSSARYGSATEVAEEVRRWLADEPVRAYPDPLPRRLARWGRRHRAVVLAASTVLVLAVVGLSTSTAMVWAEQKRTAVQEGRAVAQWSRAETNLGLSTRLSVELTRIADQRLSPIRGTERARAEIYDTSLNTFLGFLRQRPEDVSLQKSTAKIARFSANVHRVLDESELAGPLYLRSISLLESLADEFPEDSSYRSELAMVLGDYAQLIGRLGRLREAAERSRQAVRIAESLANAAPERSDLRRVLAKTLFDLASIEGQMGRAADSARLIEQAVGLYEELLKLPEGQSNTLDPLMMGSSLYVLVVARRELGRADQALSAIERGLALMRSTLEKDAEDNNAAHNLNRFLLERAQIGSGLEGRRDRAADDLEEAIDSWGKLSTGYPLVASYRESLAVARQVRGTLRASSGQLESAAEDLEAARVVLESLVSKSAEIPSYRANLGRAYLEQGRLARRAGNAELASDRLQKAVRMLEEVIDRTPEDGRNRPSVEAAIEELSLAARGKP